MEVLVRNMPSRGWEVAYEGFEACYISEVFRGPEGWGRHARIYH